MTAKIINEAYKCRYCMEIYLNSINAEDCCSSVEVVFNVFMCDVCKSIYFKEDSAKNCHITYKEINTEVEYEKKLCIKCRNEIDINQGMFRVGLK